MGHHNHSEDEETKDTFLYSGGTGAFTFIWMLLVLGFIFWIITFG